MYAEGSEGQIASVNYIVVRMHPSSFKTEELKAVSLNMS